MSSDIRAFKDLMFRHDQRILFRKQSRRILALDYSTQVVSEDSNDSCFNDKVCFERNSKELLKKKFSSELDRKLIIGVLGRNVELLEDEEQNAHNLTEREHLTAINEDEPYNLDSEGLDNYHSASGLHKSVNSLSELPISKR